MGATSRRAAPPPCRAPSALPARSRRRWRAARERGQRDIEAGVDHGDRLPVAQASERVRRPHGVPELAVLGQVPRRRLRHVPAEQYRAGVRSALLEQKIRWRRRPFVCGDLGHGATVQIQMHPSPVSSGGSHQWDDQCSGQISRGNGCSPFAPASGLDAADLVEHAEEARPRPAGRRSAGRGRGGSRRAHRQLGGAPLADRQVDERRARRSARCRASTSGRSCRSPRRRRRPASAPANAPTWWLRNTSPNSMPTWRVPNISATRPDVSGTVESHSRPIAAENTSTVSGRGRDQARTA